jgi:hypothetical protein
MQTNMQTLYTAATKAFPKQAKTINRMDQDALVNFLFQNNMLCQETFDYNGYLKLI